MKRLLSVLLVACSSNEFVPAPSVGGSPSAEPTGGSSTAAKAGAGAVSAGGERVAEGSSGGRPAAAGAGTAGQETTAGATSAGAPASDGGMGGEPDVPMGGTSSAGTGGSSSAGTGGSSAGAGGTASTCARAAQMVWKSNGINYRCDNQCALSVAKYANIEGMSCANEVTCMPDCYKSTPESCGHADAWHLEGASCVCGSCSRSPTGCKLGNQCLVSEDGLTCKEAC